MRTIRWKLSLGITNEYYKGEIDVEDGATAKEIEEMVREEVNNCLDWWWEEVGAQEGDSE